MDKFINLLCMIGLAFITLAVPESTNVFIIPRKDIKRIAIGRTCKNWHILMSSRKVDPPIDKRRLYVLNLNDLLQPLCAQNCILVLDNLLKGDLISPRIPLIIRQFEVAEKCGIYSLNYITSWIADSANIIYNASQEQWKATYLGFSPVDLFQHSSKTKPWKCQVHIQLFPHFNHFFANWVSLPPIMMEYNSVDENFLNMMPSGIPQIKVLITQHDFDDNFQDIILVSEQCHWI